jgi:hypothetical protein
MPQSKLVVAGRACEGKRQKTMPPRSARFVACRCACGWADPARIIIAAAGVGSRGKEETRSVWFYVLGLKQEPRTSILVLRYGLFVK